MRLLAVDVDSLSRNWWTLLLRGLAAVVFGLLTFFAPGISLAVLVLMWGAFALVDGAFALVSAFRQRGENGPWWVLLLQGLFGIVAGALTLLWPAITAIALLYLIAGWAVANGVLEIVAAIRLRKEIRNEWLLVLRGVLSLAVGFLLATFPGAGALAIVIWIGAYAIVVGVMLIALGIRLRSWGRSHPHHRPPAFHPAPG